MAKYKPSLDDDEEDKPAKRYRNLNENQQARVDKQIASGDFGEGRLGNIAERRSVRQAARAEQAPPPPPATPPQAIPQTPLPQPVPPQTPLPQGPISQPVPQVPLTQQAPPDVAAAATRAQLLKVQAELNQSTPVSQPIPTQVPQSVSQGRQTALPQQAQGVSTESVPQQQRPPMQTPSTPPPSGGINPGARVGQQRRGMSRQGYGQGGASQGERMSSEAARQVQIESLKKRRLSW